MIITVGAIKGGVGKSTLSIALAAELAATSNVLLVDTDRQATASTAIALRPAQAKNIAVAQVVEGTQLLDFVASQKPLFDHIILDAGGRDSTALRAALTLSAAVLIPFKPRSFDVWAVEDMLKLCDQARQVNPDLSVFGLLNERDPRGQDNVEAVVAVGENPGITVLRASIGRRKSLCNATSAGLSPSEFRPVDKAAVAEIQAVIQQLLFRSVIS